MKKYEILNKIKGNIIAIIRSSDVAASEKCLGALVAGGARAVEFTLTAKGAVFAIGRACEKYGDKLLIGAGSVLDAASAALAIHCGADFLVTPTVNEEVLAVAGGYSVPVICGAATPTEAYRAMTCGADAIKIFPASQFSFSVIKEWKAPLPGLEIVPTGGVGLANLAEWKSAGAFAYGVGGGLTAGMKNGDFAAVEETMRKMNIVVGMGGER